MAGSAIVWPAVIVAVLVPVALAVLISRIWPPYQELWATYQGEDVMLYRSRDQIAFGRASRALRRTLEANTGW
jgi:hypothetical protein